MTPIRVLLAEDHATVRHGLRLLIEGQRDMEVVGEAGDGEAVVEHTSALRPDVVVMDVSMPKQNGLSATRALRQLDPAVAVVALTRFGDDAHVREMIEAGACGYILKQSASTELLGAIRAAARGEQYLDPSLAARSAGSPDTQHRTRRISEREAAVLRLTALGHSNKEIASELGLSVKTVEVHKTNGMRKLELRGRIDVVRFAALRGWLDQA